MPFIKNLGDARHRGDVCASSIRCSIASGVDDFDFDITVAALQLFDARPAIRCAPIFPRRRPRIKGSQNLAGIADPAIDALIDAIIAADTRPDLVTACRALDRVIRAGRYWVPHWYKAVALDRLLGRVRPAARPSRAMRAAFRKPGGTIRKAQSGGELDRAWLRFACRVRD